MKITLHLPIRSVFASNFRFLHYKGIRFIPSLVIQSKHNSQQKIITYLFINSSFGDTHLNRYFYQVDHQYESYDRPAYNAKSGYIGSDLGFVFVYDGSFYKTFFAAEVNLFKYAVNKQSPLYKRTSTFGLAITSESTEDEFINTVFAHPTLSESIHESVLSAFDKPINF